MSEEDKLSNSYFELRCVRLIEKDGKIIVETVMPWDIAIDESNSTYYN
ncbi:MAG: hypothetical protein JW867_05610 [Candidatus Omnitrophica bacterium]|nr:hypothetical protein [Candidatus Omnitrophota bacterium]